jgi:hypothetical protein
MGPSVNDRTHNINGIYSYYPFKGTTVTAAGYCKVDSLLIEFHLVLGILNGDGAAFRMLSRK